MPITDYKITDTTGVKVSDIPGSTLPSSDPATNKAVFDDYSDLIVTKFNDLVDYLNTQGVSDLATWKANILKQAYPVGSIYISVNTVNPATLFGGTWEQVKDKFILAAGDTYSNGATGGSADATLPQHTHTFSGSTASTGAHQHTATTASSGAHTHSGTTGTAGAHTHMCELDNGVVKNPGDGDSTITVYRTWGNYIKAKSAGDHTHTFTTGSAGGHAHSLTTSSNGNHQHSFSGTSDSTGSSATGANMPPYFVVTMWKRTA